MKEISKLKDRPRSSFAFDSQQISKYYQEIRDVLEIMEKEYVNLLDVKKKIEEISCVLVVDKIREENNLTKLSSSLHMSFTGRPGTGKTSVAMKMALILRNLGFLTKGHVNIVSRDSLIGPYVGHTAPRTREVLKKASGGILFIDNADTIHQQNNDRDYGAEAIEMILQVMELERQKFVIIFSGEADKIEKFFRTNPGLSSRVTNHIHFNDYTVEELMKIANFFLVKEYRYQMSAEALKIFHFYLTQLVKFRSFANTRTLRVFLNQLMTYHIIRINQSLEEIGELNYQSLKIFSKEDFFYFTEEDFINLIGTNQISLYNKINFNGGQYYG